jgi:hypothetical protein
MERARALPSRAQSCRSSFPFVSERASFAAGFAQQRKKILRITSRSPQQDGSYLSELLLDKGYVVHGLKRRASSYNHPRIEHIMDSSEFFVSCSVFFEAEGATTAAFGSSLRIATIQKQATPARSASSSTTLTSSTSARSASCSGEKSRKGVRDRRELVSKREERVWLFF